MPRNTPFHSQSHEPLRADPSLELHHDRVTGLFSFLNPTRAAFKHTPAEDKSFGFSNDPQNGNSGHSLEEKHPKHGDEQLASDIEFKWRSRDKSQRPSCFHHRSILEFLSAIYDAKSNLWRAGNSQWHWSQVHPISLMERFVLSGYNLHSGILCLGH